jgi:virginiamycin B lyase
MGSNAAKLVVSMLLLCGCLILAASAAAAPSVTGTFPLGSEIETNNKLVAGPDGNIWLTVGGGNDVAKVTPGGQVEEFDLPEISGTNGIAVGPDGNLWVPTVNQVTKFSPGSPVGTAQTFTDNLINNGGQIVTGPDGQLWVASQNSLVHFSTGNPEAAESVTLEGGELAPKDIDVAGSLIVVADGSGENRIATFTTVGVQKDFAIGGPSQGVAGGPGGQIAFSAALAVPEMSGLISPPSPAQSFELAGDPFGVALGGDGAYWIVQFAAGQLARVTTGGQLSFPVQGLPKESARQIATGPGGTLWVTLVKNGEPGAVARISGVEPPPPSATPTSTPTTIPTPPMAPRTILGPGRKLFKTHRKKAKVKFKFTSPDIALRFECSLTKLRGKKASGGAFRLCSSPQIYRLAAGRYRFAVRALNGPTPDPTPATRTIRVVHVR